MWMCRRRCWTTFAKRAWQWARQAALHKPLAPTRWMCPLPTAASRSPSWTLLATRSALHVHLPLLSFPCLWWQPPECHARTEQPITLVLDLPPHWHHCQLVPDQCGRDWLSHEFVMWMRGSCQCKQCEEQASDVRCLGRRHSAR